MKKAILGIVGAVVVLAVAFVAYQYVAAGDGEPSTELTAPAIDPTSTEVTSEASPTSAATTESSSDTTASSTAARELVISSATATFELDEVLRGTPTHVVGATTDVVGRVQFDPTDLSSAALSDIVINARTLATDSSSRDRAIRSPVVLDSGSDEHELITFSPITIDGLPESAEAGDEVTFTVSGDLLIKGTTNPVTFDVTLTFVSDSEMSGVATTTVDRTEWGIDIPSVSSVADVSEEVVLTLEFTATP